MANVATTKQLIRLCREAEVTLYLWGVHGVGKSSIVRQVAEELNIGWVDLRCAQIEAADLRGLPQKGDDGKTHFLPPADLPSDGEGILFLDELNRAPGDVLAAAFQLVLDRRVGEYQLPPGWSIVAAGNVDNGDYTVSELDLAFRDRFCHVVLAAGNATFAEWADWISQHYPDQSMDVVDFCGSNLAHLEAEVKEELGFTITPSRRSWEMVARILRAWDGGAYDERVRTEAIAGLVGRTIAITFTKHRVPLSPKDILAKGVAKLATKIGRLNRNQKMALMWGLVSHVKRQIQDEKIAEIVLDFAELLFADEKDLAIALCSSLISELQPGRTRVSPAQELALLANPRLAAAVARVNREWNQTPEFIDHLVARPQLASAVARAMSITSETKDEVCP